MDLLLQIRFIEIYISSTEKRSFWNAKRNVHAVVNYTNCGIIVNEVTQTYTSINMLNIYGLPHEHALLPVIARLTQC